MAGRKEPVGATTVLGRVQEMLGRLPGLGPKSAERVTHHLLNSPREEVLALAEALRELKDRLHRCATCCMPTEDENCHTCATDCTCTPVCGDGLGYRWARGELNPHILADTGT